MKTRIFLDGGNPEETKELIGVLGFLDGQTTNPTLVSKNPEVRERIEEGEKYSEQELFDCYRDVLKVISGMMPNGSVSVEVYADPSTKADEMLEMGREMFTWIPNAQVKFPTSTEGLQAAEQACREKIRVNMTLCFTQAQAAAVYAATKGARRGDVFVSPFIGRLDDRGENGMDVIRNIITMYRAGDGHVEVLTASVRNLNHLLCAIKLGSDIVTAPYEILKEWGVKGCPMPGDDFRYEPKNLKPIPYQDLPLDRDWRSYDLGHPLTVKGMEKFSEDWNKLLQAAV